MLEAALRTLERRFAWEPAGLLFTVGWGPRYFERGLRVRSPVPQARALSDSEQPAIDDYDLCLHLASNSQPRLLAVERALVGGRPLAGAHGRLDVSDVLRWRETRTGFIGDGLPAAHQRVARDPGRRSDQPPCATVHGVSLRPAPQPGQRG